MTADVRIFVTGATGYIGTALCRRLAAGGHEVRALVRATSRTEDLEEVGAALFPGDVRDRVSMRKGMSGADWVVHAAAELDFDAPGDRMVATNVEGSRNVASLAYKLGVGRFLSVSSIAYFGGSSEDGSPVDEEAPVRRPLPTRYSRTKHAGQMAIEEWADRGLAVNTVFPSLVYGPPGKDRGANAVLRSLIRGRFPILVGADRRSSWVYLDDVVDGIVRVVERADPGRRFLLAGEVTTVREVSRAVCALAGAEVPRREISARTAALGLRLLGPVLRLFGKRPPVSREQLAPLERHWAFDDSRAREELDWRPRDLDSGLPATVSMLTEEGRRAA